MADSSTQFHSSDGESQQNQALYHDLLQSIERRHDPSSNTVLVVDDSRLVRKAVTRSIAEKDEHVVIVEAGDGIEALQQLAEIRETYERDPLFIVLDLEMPNMDGWEFLDHLRQDYESRGLDQGVPVIVLSSSSGEKGRLLFRKTVHGKKAHYSPMVTIAKDNCLKPSKYDSAGQKGVSAWIRHFLRHAT